MWPATIPLFHWLQLPSMCCLFPIGYLHKPTSTGWRICHQLSSLTTSIGQGDIPTTTLLTLSSAGWSCQHVCWYKSPAEHGDILAITLLILSSAGWNCQHIHQSKTPAGHGDIPVITPILSMYLSTTSAVFNPAGPINILQYNCVLTTSRTCKWKISKMGEEEIYSGKQNYNFEQQRRKHTSSNIRKVVLLIAELLHNKILEIKISDFCWLKISEEELYNQTSNSVLNMKILERYFLE